MCIRDRYYVDGETINDGIKAEIMRYVAKLEEMTGKKFGDPDNPLLVSVRSGSRASMPGMMDTILNLGMNDTVVEAFGEKTNNPRFAYDSYRRFIQMYSDVVMEVGKSHFEKLIDEMKDARGVTQDTELTADDLKELAEEFKAQYKDKIGSDFPSDPVEQLFGAIKAVFRSWDNPRAVYYRRMNDIPGDWGTAVNVQKAHPEWKVVPEIMIPLVGEVKELAYVKGIVAARHSAGCGSARRPAAGRLGRLQRGSRTRGTAAVAGFRLDGRRPAGRRRLAAHLPHPSLRMVAQRSEHGRHSPADRGGSRAGQRPTVRGIGGVVRHGGHGSPRASREAGVRRVAEQTEGTSPTRRGTGPHSLSLIHIPMRWKPWSAAQAFVRSIRPVRSSGPRSSPGTMRPTKRSHCSRRLREIMVGPLARP